MSLSGACNFSIKQEFYSANDITWSFQYKLESLSGSSAGLCTFLYDKTSIGLSGGYGFGGLGFGPSLYTEDDGVQNAFIVVGVDSTGSFGTSGTHFSTGLSAPIPNSLTIRTGNNYQYLSCIALSTLNLPNLSSSDYYNTIRFRLTDVGRKLIISVKDIETNLYTTNFAIETGLITEQNSVKNIGFSFATPVISSDDTCSLYLKDIHYHGVLRPSRKEIKPIPYNREKITRSLLMLLSGSNPTPDNGFITSIKEDPSIAGIFID
jgi:hypothetical protein